MGRDRKKERSHEERPAISSATPEGRRFLADRIGVRPPLSDFINAFLLVYAALFPIVNPIGGAPVFLSLTRAETGQRRTVLAGLVARNSFLLLLGSVLIGSHILVFFGISLPVLRIAGGLVVTAFGWNMLNAPATTGPEETAPAPRTDSFYPLTLPATVGPGSISVAITLGSQRPRVLDSAHALILGSGMVVGLLALAATIYLCFRFAERIVRLLGGSGTDVVIRLSAFILLCIGIQIIWGGVSALLGLPQA